MALSTSLTPYYKLNTNNATQPDATVTGNDGAVTGATYTASGKISGAYVFDGNDYIKPGTNLAYGSSSWTFQFWFKTGSANNMCFAVGYNIPDIVSVGINAGVLGIYVRDGGGDNDSYTLTDATDWADDSWHHVVFRFDIVAQELEIWVDGNDETNSQTVNGTISNLSTAGATYFGYDYVNSRQGFIGTIDEIAFWKRAISDAEITELYNSGDGLQYPFVSITLAITAPNGGESYVQDRVRSVTWTDSGAVANVKLEYSDDDGVSYVDIVASTVNDGSYDWTVPGVNTVLGLVRVSDVLDVANVDVSDAVFNIISPPSQVTGGTSFPLQSWLKLALLLENAFHGVLEWSNTMIKDFGWMSRYPQIVSDFGAKVVKVHDGDTITLRTSFRDFDFPLRIMGIDAPELNEGGQEAQAWLEKRLLGQQVVVGVNPDNRVGKYGRLIGSVYQGGFDVADEMLMMGLVARFGQKGIFDIPSFPKLMKNAEVPYL